MSGLNQFGGNFGFDVFGIASGFVNNSGLILDPDAQAIIDAMSPAPSIERQALINNFVIGCKEDSIWDLLDVLYFMAASSQDSALVNWKNPGVNNITISGSPVFTTDRGYTTSSGNYLNTNWNPGDAVNFTLNSACFGIYSRTAGQLGSGVIDAGCVDAGGNAVRCGLRGTDNLIRLRLNSATNTTHASSDASGLTSFLRSASNNVAAYKNGIIINSTGNNSSSIPSLDIYIGCQNTNGVAGSFSTREYCCAFFGSGNIDQLSIYNRIQTYLSSIGASV